MLKNIIENVEPFISDHYEIILVVGLIFVVLALIVQGIINHSMEEELQELAERIEAIEKENKTKEE